jgi:excisionase family DNA binding protein
MPQTVKRQWLDYDSAAAYMGCTPRQLRRWVENRQVPFTKLGGHVRFDPAELDAWLESQTFRPEESAQ